MFSEKATGGRHSAISSLVSSKLFLRRKKALSQGLCDSCKSFRHDTGATLNVAGDLKKKIQYLTSKVLNILTEYFKCKITHCRSAFQPAFFPSSLCLSCLFLSKPIVSGVHPGLAFICSWDVLLCCQLVSNSVLFYTSGSLLH